MLVTGATGFVGSHLLDALRAQDRPVRALVRPTSDARHCHSVGAEVFVADPMEPDAIAGAMQNVSVVFHLAAATRARDEREYERANVGFTRALMTAARAATTPPRVVYLGSLAAVGPTRDGEPVREDEIPHPITAYGRTKLAGERIVLGTEGVASIALRPPTVYGPRDRDLLTFFRMAARGVMPVPAGADRPVQLVHVRDLVAALGAAAEASAPIGVYHIAEPVIRPWSDVVEMIARAVGRTHVRVPVPRPALWLAAAASEAAARVTGRATIFNRDKVRELLAPGWLCTTERAERRLGFRASIPLEQGIPETADWYRSEGWLSVPG